MKVRTCAPAAGQGLEEDGRHRGERLALAGRHLDDLPLGEGEAGEDLLVERPLAEGAPGRLAGEGEGLGELRLDLRPVGHAGAQRAGPLREAGVVERRHRGLERGDPGEHLPVGRQVVLDRPTAQSIEKGGEAQASQSTVEAIAALVFAHRRSGRDSGCGTRPAHLSYTYN